MPIVLIADDSMLQRFALAKAVSGHGDAAVKARNGKEWLEVMFHPQTFDRLLAALNTMMAKQGMPIAD